MRRICKGTQVNIKADVIVLGSSLSGAVTANKLRRKFGNSMDIVVLDLGASSRVIASKCNVAFREDVEENEAEDSDPEDNETFKKCNEIQTSRYDARQYLIKYGNEFRVPIPDPIINPLTDNPTERRLQKLFQHSNGSFVPCNGHFNDFDYLNVLQKFELNQYQNLLDKSMNRLFQSNKYLAEEERQRLLYYDQTTMEKNICDTLLLSTSREIMRNSVELVCGAPADAVSILFYLHQCHRTNGTRNHLDGQNTRHREKLLGYCRKRLAIQIQESVADITLRTNPIKNIRKHTEADTAVVIIETIMGETTYICTLLAMALTPDQLQTIEVDTLLLPEKEASIIKGLTPGKAKKFIIQYVNSFWEEGGFSGDILSVRGPIVWAMPRPSLSLTGSVEKYAGLVGYLIVKDGDMEDSKDAVIEQLICLFGPAAGSPVKYKETPIADIFIPKCGDYVGLRVLTSQVTPRMVEWGAFDLFDEGDVTAALEAGHTAYLHMLTCLRPQAQTYEDISAGDWPIYLDESPITWFLAHINMMSTLKLTLYTAALVVGIKLVRSYIKS